jgi:putative ABC transport system permease protein
VVIVATNKEGSVNGINLRVGGISENLFGPTGKDAYMHLDDARTLLRIEGDEIGEIAIKLERFDTLKSVFQELSASVGWMLTDEGQPIAEVHTWEQLTPFKSIANMIDLLIAMIRVVLIAIVLISVMNVMLMSVYERISEIGTIASIGTPPGRILSLFLVEGLSLGLISSIAGSLIGMGVLLYLKMTTFTFKMGAIEMTFAPDIPIGDVLMTGVLVLVISVISGFQPALKASRLEPVEALRHV